MSELSQKVEEYISEIQKRAGMSREEVMSEFNERLAFFKADPQFQNVENLEGVVWPSLWSKYVSRMAVKQTDVIPVGFEGMRLTKSNKKMSAIYVITRVGPNDLFRRISLSEVVADAYRSVNILSENGAYRYTVKLGTYGDDPTADFSADDRAVFNSPNKIALTPKMFREMFNIPVLKINQLAQNPTKQKSDGYENRTDWRCVRGTISSGKMFMRKKSGLEGGVYRIIDETTPTETYVKTDGTKVESTLTVWTAPELVGFKPQSICDFYGTVALDKKTKSPSMNAFNIIPILAERKEAPPQ